MMFAFPVAIDESADIIDVARPAIFIHGVAETLTAADGTTEDVFSG